MAPPGSDRQTVHEIKTRAIRDCQILCATCIGAGSEMLKDHMFAAVLMDEATQGARLRVEFHAALGNHS